MSQHHAMLAQYLKVLVTSADNSRLIWHTYFYCRTGCKDKRQRGQISRGFITGWSLMWSAHTKLVTYLPTDSSNLLLLQYIKYHSYLFLIHMNERMK